MFNIIKRVFLTLCLTSLLSEPIYADELSLKISLGIRDNKVLTTPSIAYPLVFKIQNTGKTLIKKDQIPLLFFKGIIHILPKNEKEQQTDFQKVWRTSAADLQPEAIFESPLLGNLLSFFPATPDGAYQVWWTLEDFRSNVLNFTVSNGKLVKNEL